MHTECRVNSIDFQLDSSRVFDEVTPEDHPRLSASFGFKLEVIVMLEYNFQSLLQILLVSPFII